MFHLGARAESRPPKLLIALCLKQVVDRCWQTRGPTRASCHVTSGHCSTGAIPRVRAGTSSLVESVLADKQASPLPSIFNRRQLARLRLQGFCSPGCNRYGGRGFRIDGCYGDIFPNCFASVSSSMGRFACRWHVVLFVLSRVLFIRGISWS